MGKAEKPETRITGKFLPNGTSRPNKQGKINYKRFEIKGDDIAITGSIYVPFAGETPDEIVLVAA